MPESHPASPAPVAYDPGPPVNVEAAEPPPPVVQAAPPPPAPPFVPEPAPVVLQAPEPPPAAPVIPVIPVADVPPEKPKRGWWRR